MAASPPAAAADAPLEFGIVRCIFVAKPFADPNGDISASVALRFDESTRGETIVREALRHATEKLNASLASDPQHMHLFIRVDDRLFRVDLGLRLVQNKKFIEAARLGNPTLMLSAPDRVQANVKELTSTHPSRARSAQADRAASPVNSFASFVRRPNLDAAVADADGGGEPEPEAPAAVVPRATTDDTAGFATPRQGSSVATRSASPPDGAPRWIRAIYYSMYGERVEVPVEYTPTDSTDAVVKRAAQLVSRELDRPLPPSEMRDMALFYRRRDGSERVLRGEDPLPEARGNKVPRAFLARLPSDSPFCQRAPQGSPPVSPKRTPQADSLVPPPPREQRIDSVLDRLHDAYRKLDGEAHGSTAPSELQKLEHDRTELTRQRRSFQEQWTECASLGRDIERLREQIEWFEREVSEQHDREVELRQRLHKLQSEALVAGTITSPSR